MKLNIQKKRRLSNSFGNIRELAIIDIEKRLKNGNTL